ncbi:MAG TPA: beta-1,6-N-acetylglucosaminyltransferase [Puia sp.]|nr:beta-1,6-N-acetylglucosaminyltransferase [Puia sp.]
MEINYIILAHKGPQQLARLLEKLFTRESRFYIHIDKDVEMYPFMKELGHYCNVFFLADAQRIAAVWADFSMVLATINCMQQIIADKRKGYCVLMSGQDYPIKSSAYINEFLSSQYGVNFIQGYPILPTECAEQGVRRINRYKVNLSKTRNDILVFPSIFDKEFYRRLNFESFLYLAKRKSIVSCLEILAKTLKKRRFPSYIQPYKGSQWWALPIESVHFIHDFIKGHPDYLAYHFYTFAPDEIFFQSIIHSMLDKIRIREDVTYVNWRPDNYGPLLLKEINFDEVMEKGRDKLFARKFDIEIDSRILDLIDKENL